jgi:hypothetical protein
MRNSWLRRIVISETGVYQPPPLKLEAILLIAALLIVVVSVALSRASILAVFPALVVLGSLATIRLMLYRRYGALGKPNVALRERELTFTLPQDSRGQVGVSLAELQQLIVYGRSGRRIFRFVRQNGTHFEVVPGWSVKVEQAAVEFLQGRLSPALRVSVEEPHTIFASFRGDGPYTDP